MNSRCLSLEADWGKKAQLHSPKSHDNENEYKVGEGVKKIHQVQRQRPRPPHRDFNSPGGYHGTRPLARVLPDRPAAGWGEARRLEDRPGGDGAVDTHRGRGPKAAGGGPLGTAAALGHTTCHGPRRVQPREDRRRSKATRASSGATGNSDRGGVGGSKTPTRTPAPPAEPRARPKFLQLCPPRCEGARGPGRGGARGLRLGPGSRVPGWAPAALASGSGRRAYLPPGRAPRLRLPPPPTPSSRL